MVNARKSPDAHDAVATQLATRAIERSAGADDVSAQVQRGCLVLTGRVQSPTERADVERAVRPVPGVSLIVNHVEVSPGRDDAGAEHPRGDARSPSPSDLTTSPTANAHRQTRD